jgi:hypothetical protein
LFQEEVCPHLVDQLQQQHRRVLVEGAHQVLVGDHQLPEGGRQQQVAAAAGSRQQPAAVGSSSSSSSSTGLGQDSRHTWRQAWCLLEAPRSMMDLIMDS